MNFVSLFSGIGGFDLAFERAGMQCVAQVEIDKNCLSVLSHYWPNVKRYEDIRNVDRYEFGSVDLICGGFPCQDLSVAGRREGLAGERSGLWFEFHRIIADALPRWVVIENVPGLLSSNGGRDFAVILRGLVECGYGVCWRILDAQHFGLAQRRRRVFIVASLGSGRCAQVLFESEGVSGDSAESREAGARVARAISASPTATGRLDPNGRDFVVSAVDVRNLREQPDNTSGTLQGKKSGGYSLNYQNPIAFDWRVGDDSKFHTGPNGKHPGGGAKEIVRQGDCAGALNATRQDAIAWNWQSGGDVRLDFNERPMLQSSQVPAVGVRRLTPTECERLQGFPDGWTAINNQSDSVRYRQLGNAVAVPVVEWIGKRIIRQSSP